MRLMTASQGGPWVIRQSQATSDPLSGPSKIKTGSGLWWTILACLHTSVTFMRPYALRMQPYAVRMHFMHLFWELDLFRPFSF